MAEESPNMFTEDFFNSKYEKGEKLVKSFFVMCADMFKSCTLITEKYCSAEISSRMAAFQPKVTTIMESYLTNEWTLTNLIHGDAWYNNFMYR